VATLLRYLLKYGEIRIHNGDTFYTLLFYINYKMKKSNQNNDKKTQNGDILTESLRIRCSKEQKEGWNKFIKENPFFFDLSKFFRYLANGYIMGDIIEKERLQEFNGTSKELEVLKDMLSMQEKESQKFRENITEIFQRLNEKQDSKISISLKGQVLTLLKKTSYTPEELVKGLNREDHEIYDVLADLMNKNLIDFNNKGEYFAKQKL